MNRTIGVSSRWICSSALVTAGILLAQGPGAQAQGQSKSAPRNPAQSPASQPRPRTGTPQTYPSELIQAGALRFTSQCGFCHGRDTAGGETGPDLTRSQLVAEDTAGDRIGPLLRQGRPEQGMPSFNLSDTDLAAVAAFIHDQRNKFEALGGGRRSVDPADLATGDAEAGRRYFNGAGGCARCHSGTGDLSGIASRYSGLALLQQMLSPRSAAARPKVTLSLASGRTLVGTLASEDEFTFVVLDPAGARKTYKKNTVKFKIDDPMSAHFDQLGKYTDADMHNVFAYLDTLK